MALFASWSYLLTVLPGGAGAEGDRVPAAEAACEVSPGDKSNYAAIEQDRLAGEARRVRVNAELAEADDVSFPSELTARGAEPRTSINKPVACLAGD
jgi:hypothetical protein